MSVEKDIQKKLEELLLLVKTIPDTVICAEAPELRDMATEFTREIYNKFAGPQQNMVELSD